MALSKKERDAYNAGIIAALVATKVHHMQMTGVWDHIDPDFWEEPDTEEKLQELLEISKIPFCSNCFSNALYKRLDNGEYTYCLSNYCPNCGAILNAETTNKSSDINIQEYVDKINAIYNSLEDDL